MDKDYWEAFYAKRINELKPSLFAQYVNESIVRKNCKLIELGCGNGRDAILFANNNIDVLAIDQCESEINFLNNTYNHIGNIKFKLEDFTDLTDEQKFDFVYSRFTIHSISAKQQTKVLNWVYQNLNAHGAFCIEARGLKNEIYGKGNPVEGEKDAYILDNHYRRFINLDAICYELEQIGFSIKLAEEKKGFAPFNGEDETFIRIIAYKM